MSVIERIHTAWLYENIIYNIYKTHRASLFALRIYLR